jgi:NAD(P)-dependent dehydrogenase (short-subunit alcohol dehydrogenase family)
MKTSIRDLFDLSGKIAIVTGGATGLGKQIADAYAELGASLVLCSRDADRCQQEAKAISTAHGVQAMGLRCDVRSLDEVKKMVDAVVVQLGRIDIVVNNAGTTWMATPEAMPLDGWQKVVDVNLTGTFLVSQAAGRRMIERGGGKIVNIASVAGLRGAPPEVMNSLPYQATKAGVIGLTRDLAWKWAQHGIYVNAIAPGWFPSEMTQQVLAERADLLLRAVPLKRFGSDVDLKGAAAFLASAASDYVTGQVLAVDGGQTA